MNKSEYEVLNQKSRALEIQSYIKYCNILFNLINKKNFNKSR